MQRILTFYCVVMFYRTKKYNSVGDKKYIVGVNDCRVDQKELEILANQTQLQIPTIWSQPYNRHVLSVLSSCVVSLC